MQFEFPSNQDAIIKVIGIGGGGGNAVNNMFEKGIEGVDFMVCNTDMQALKNSAVPTRIRLGANQTQGLGAGANPEVGKKSAIESLDDMREALANNTRMVFVTAGMGGGTGTGAAPVVASMTREMGILTVGIVTLPFRFEGPKRQQSAVEGIRELESVVDTLIVIDNNNLQTILGSNVTMRKAFEEADRVLFDAARGIAEIITTEGYINVDFADVCTIMRDGGKALMGTAVAEGENRAMDAVEMAINSPLLDNISLRGARGIVVNITASEESLRMDETTDVVEHIQNTAGHEANIIYGIVYDEKMGEQLRVTVIATRFVDEPEAEAEGTSPVSQDQKKQAEEAEDTLPQPPIQPRQRTVRLGEPSGGPSEVERLRQEDFARRRTQKEREETLRKLNSKAYDVHDPESLDGLERVPAYVRRSVDLASEDTTQQRVKRSRVSLDADEEQGYKLREQNGYLHDNAD